MAARTSESPPDEPRAQGYRPFVVDMSTRTLRTLRPSNRGETQVVLVLILELHDLLQKGWNSWNAWQRSTANRPMGPVRRQSGDNLAPTA